MTISTIPCRQDPLRQTFPTIVASAAQIVDAPKHLLDGSFTFTVLARPGMRSVALNSDSCRGFKSFVVLDATARHIDIPMLPYPGGHARRAPSMKRDASFGTGSVAGLLPIPNLNAQLDDSRGKIYAAESDGLAYYLDAVPPGRYYLTVSGEGYKGRLEVDVAANVITRRDVALNDLTPGF